MLKWFAIAGEKALGMVAAAAAQTPAGRWEHSE